MYGVRMEGSFEPILAGLDKFLAFQDDLVSLGDIIAADMKQGNEEGLLAGQDRFGNEMPDTQRELNPYISGKYGSGEPLNPMGSISRSISDFTVEVDAMTGGAVSIVGRWPNTPFIKYHRGASARWNRPARDIVGIRPETMQVIGQHIREWIEAKIAGFK